MSPAGGGGAAVGVAQDRATVAAQLGRTPRGTVPAVPAGYGDPDPFGGRCDAPTRNWSGAGAFGTGEPADGGGTSACRYPLPPAASPANRGNAPAPA